jgi:exosortase A
MKMEHVSTAETVVPHHAGELSAEQKYAIGLIGAALFWLLAWYAATAMSMVATWHRSDTFAHGFLILPISGWLVWRQRHDLKAVELQPSFLALPVLALIGFGWLLGESGGVTVVQQYALVLMIPAVVWAIAGTRMVRKLAFPLFFLLFAVPFGEVLLAPLMEYTADFAILALRLTGIPVYREGLFFTVPSGSWSVVEACSGLRYLIASLTIGLLFAHIMYRSPLRRAIFILAAIAVPIVANWLRAYMIVMIGHLSSMQYAVGVDHLIYGWLFFGVVMAILFWFAAFWREDFEPVPANADAVRRVPLRRPALIAFAAAAVGAAIVIAVWPLAATRLDDSLDNLSPTLQPPGVTGGWLPMDDDIDWAPYFLSPRAQFRQGYKKDNARAGLYIAFYAGERPGAELVSSVNRLVSAHQTRWANLGEAGRTLIVNGRELPSIEARLRGPSSSELLVWRWYQVDGQLTASAHFAKLLQAKSRLLGRGDDGAVIIVYTEAGEDPQAAAARLQNFVSAMLPGINRSVNHAR